jgi:hypothetical protein
MLYCPDEPDQLSSMQWRGPELWSAASTPSGAFINYACRLLPIYRQPSLTSGPTRKTRQSLATRNALKNVEGSRGQRSRVVCKGSQLQVKAQRSDVLTESFRISAQSLQEMPGY